MSLSVHRAGAHQRVSGERTEDIRSDLLGLAVKISVYKRNMVIRHNTVSKGRKPLLYSLDDDTLW